MFTRELKCQELVELVTDYLEGELPWRTRRRFEKHIGGCPHCTEYLTQIRETISASGRLTPETIDPAARDALLDAFRGWHARQGSSGEAPA